ncbi:MAG: hypothetical protein H6492_03055, partial [Candidatus Paracaedibacteraceae bacterium]|nr:hypothetical protein [Candidatus Paracaedibacteraceae bacterium]
MKIYCYLFIYLFTYLFNPLQAAFGLELTPDEEAAIVAKYPTLSFEEFKEEYIGKNQPFRIVEFGGDRRRLYEKWVKKNGPDIPLYCWSLIEADIPKGDTRSSECELCGHTELGTLNKATHPRLETRSEGYVKFVGSRCITYAVKNPKQLYEEFLAALPYVRSDAVATERTKRRKAQDDLLTQAERNPEFRRKIAELREAEPASEDEEEAAVARRASLRSAHGRRSYLREVS